MKRPGRAALRLACVGFALTACNAVLGIGVPNLVDVDAGGKGDATLADSRGSDAVASEPEEADTSPGDASMAEASAADTSMLDSTGADGGLDAPDSTLDSAVLDSASQDGGPFDGNCTCASAACAPVLLATAQSSPKSIAYDSTGIYWIDVGSGAAADGSLMRVDHDGTHLTTLAGSLFAPTDVAVGGGMVYWSSNVPGSVQRESTSLASSPQTISMTGANAVASNGTGAVWTYTAGSQGGIQIYGPSPDSGALLVQDSHDPNHIAVDATQVFWGSNNGLNTCPLSGCSSATQFWASTDSVDGIATDGVGVYWADSSAGLLYACPTTGCPTPNPTTIYTPPAALGLPKRVTTDGVHIYMTTSTGFPATGAVVRVGLDGSGASVIAMGGDLEGIAVGDTCVYWSDQTSSSVYAAAK